MTALQIVSLLVMAAGFFVATKWRLSLGILLLPAAFVIGTVGGLDTKTITDGFPTEMFLLLLGLTFLFTVVEANGTMKYIMDVLLGLVGTRVILVPFILFFVAAIATGVGVYAVAVLALLIPIGMRFARQFDISIFLVSLMTIHGMLAGLFSPIAIDGVFAERLLSDAGLPTNALQLFLCHIAVHAILCLAAFFLFGGIKLFRNPPSLVVDDEPSGTSNTPGSPQGSLDTPAGGSVGTVTDVRQRVTVVGDKVRVGTPTLYQACTMLAIGLLIVSAVFTEFDLGFVALTLGVALALVFQRTGGEELVTKVPWTVMLLIGGVLTYISVMTEIGTLDAIGDVLTGFDQPAVGVLLLSFFTAITSAFTSTLGVLGASMPLSIPMMDGGMSMLSVVGPVTISATVVDASPMGIGGALVLACALPEERNSLFRKMALWGFAMVLIGPLLSWTIFTVL
ncbi:SLC13 family permease [Rhodococcus sp. NPDC127530]|uniref:SLC13 family permease n=1 Tax=unclassified Rhodococcus (in: high G+C Gram-positive bacteria) TaxID=192944 RepID=UPI0036292DC8